MLNRGSKIEYVEQSSLSTWYIPLKLGRSSHSYGFIIFVNQRNRNRSSVCRNRHARTHHITRNILPSALANDVLCSIEKHRTTTTLTTENSTSYFVFPLLFFYLILSRNYLTSVLWRCTIAYR